MPIDRTNFNLMIDDDGTGTTGTPWNKARTKDVVLDPVDAALNPVNAPSTAGHLIGGSLTIGGVLAWPTAAYWHATTADGADTGTIRLVAGGSYEQSRGASLLLGGNEAVGLPGSLYLYAGTATGAGIHLVRGDGATALFVDGASGAISLYYDLTFQSGSVVLTQSTTIRHNTADGADTRTTTLAAGGAGTQARGALINLSGNEAGGQLALGPGNVPTGAIYLYRGDGTVALSIDGGLGTTAVNYGLRLSGDLVLPATGAHLYPLTSDGADTGQLRLSGGGGSGQTRGAGIVLLGNENAQPGALQFVLGNVAGSYARFYRNDGAVALSIDGATGQVSLPLTSLSCAANMVISVNTTDGADTGAIYLTAGGAADRNRGAYLALGGADAAGNIVLQMGNNASAYCLLAGPAGTGVLTIYATGAASFVSSAFITSSFDSTSIDGGVTQWARSGSLYGQIGNAKALFLSASNADFGLAASAALYLSATNGVFCPQVYSLTTGSPNNVNVDTSGILRRGNVSSRRYKTAIQPLATDEGLTTVLQLRPVSSIHHNDAGVARLGFIAEEVAAVDPRLAILDALGRPDEVAYGHLAAPLVAAVHALHARLTALERTDTDGTV